MASHQAAQSTRYFCHSQHSDIWRAIPEAHVSDVAKAAQRRMHAMCTACNRETFERHKPSQRVNNTVVAVLWQQHLVKGLLAWADLSAAEITAMLAVDTEDGAQAGVYILLACHLNAVLGTLALNVRTRPLAACESAA